ncbi:cyclophilin-like fold protein [Streptococcus rupicaprae]
MRLGNMVIPAILSHTGAAKILLERLPIKTTACTGGLAICGQILPLPYDSKEVQGGWFAGDICYDPSGDWLSIYLGGDNAKPYLQEVFLGQLGDEVGLNSCRP